MILLIPSIYIINLFLSVFNIYHIIAISFAYGAYVMIRTFTTIQEKMAFKKGLSKELEEINKLEKKDRNDRPRWIK